MTGEQHDYIEFVLPLTFQVAQSASGKLIAKFPVNTFGQDIHIDRVSLFLENAPGAGQAVTVYVTDGTNTMSAGLTETDNTASTTNNFDLDASAETLAITYNSGASSVTGNGVVILTCHTITLAA